MQPDPYQFKTAKGRMYQGDSLKVIQEKWFVDRYKGKVDLVFTSPPFPLTREKSYGNLRANAYVEWLSSYALPLTNLLSPEGSIVLEVGNNWEPGVPTMGTWTLEALLEFKRKAKLNLCQQMIWHNTAKLPGPAIWVNIERIRLKDAFTYIWWMSPSVRPFADNRRILRDYSDAMKKLLRTKKYNAGQRPSEHLINGVSFLKKNSGSIRSSVQQVDDGITDDVTEQELLDLLTQSDVHAIGHTNNTPDYVERCKMNGITPHPARMPVQLAERFINFLTRDNNSLVLDPFGGSNVTGYAAEKLGRNWVSIEMSDDYIAGAACRFSNAKFR
jgi:DNA modification methylase